MRTAQKPGEAFCAYVRRRRAERQAMALHVCSLAEDSTSARLAERFTLAMCGCTCAELLTLITQHPKSQPAKRNTVTS